MSRRLDNRRIPIGQYGAGTLVRKKRGGQVASALLYFGTANAGPYDLRQLGPGVGDALFTATIIAINPDTGRMAWYFQTTPGDHWDFDAVQKLILADLTIDGQSRHVIMQANKNGFFYVLERKR